MPLPIPEEILDPGDDLLGTKIAGQDQDQVSRDEIPAMMSHDVTTP